MARLTVTDITNKQFIENDYGYDKYDVDGFLDEICDEIETLTNERDMYAKERDELNNTCAGLQQQLEQGEQQRAKTENVSKAAPVSEEAEMTQVVNMLSMTKKLQKEVLARAEEEANAIRTRATAEAAETLQNLENEKNRLTDEVASLKKVAIEYRGKFELLLQAQQDALDKATDLF